MMTEVAHSDGAGESDSRFATTIFRYSFKNLVNKAVGPGGWSVIK